jgi:PBP1b-binding outer membrane lipoprotein LpoB
MNIHTVRTSTAILAVVALLTLFLAGCSHSSQGAPEETDAQKTKREAIIQQHKDAADNVR